MVKNFRDLIARRPAAWRRQPQGAGHEDSWMLVTKVIGPLQILGAFSSRFERIPPGSVSYLGKHLLDSSQHDQQYGGAK